MFFSSRSLSPEVACTVDEVEESENVYEVSVSLWQDTIQTKVE